MAAELVTPTDALTGLPLPMLPTEVLPLDNPQVANRHHHWHPSNAPELDINTLAGAALRRSRVQLVRAADHNYRQNGKLTYHDIFIGPPLPTTEQAIFKACVLAVAGYIPDQAIDMRGDNPNIVHMTEHQIGLLRMMGRPRAVTDKKVAKLRAKAAAAYEVQTEPSVSQETFVDQFVQDYINTQERRAGFTFHHFSYGYEPIRDFFRSYTLSQDLGHVGETNIEEFLSTHDIERKRFLGHWLLSKAVEVIADDVYETYKRVRNQGSLHPLMPKSPRLLVRNALGRTNQRDILTLQLEETLKVRYGLAA